MLKVTMEIDGMRIGERLVITLHRTLRLPEDGHDYPLPPGLGRLPIVRTNLPGREEAYVVPLYRREALWIGFGAAPWKPNAVKVIVGGINAVSGQPDDGRTLRSLQDYLVCPDQVWLDGFNIGGGIIRQFVAMPLGEGYAVEASLGQPERGGLRLIGFEPRPGRFPDQPPPAPTGPERLRGLGSAGPGQVTMGLGAGGTMRQRIYPDPHGIEVWDPENYGAVSLEIVDSRRFQQLTGVPPPPTPIDAQTYTAYGLPWFELYDEPKGTVASSGGFRLKTIAERDAELGRPSGDAPIAVMPGQIHFVGQSGPGHVEQHSTTPRYNRRSPMTGAPKICFDRLLPQDLARPLTAPQTDLEAIIVVGKLWPNGSTLRVRFMEGSPDQKRLAMEQASWWAEVGNLRFVESNDLDAEIRVTFDANDGAWSYVGTDCRSIPQDQPTMNLGFQDGGTSGHEFGHAIGLAHEHQNPEGGIEWNEAEVIRDLSGPPNRWTVEQIRHNVLRKYSRDQVRGTRFDDRSIMLYAFPASWTRNGIATHSNEVPSDMDRSFIAQVYPRGDTGDLVRLTVGTAPTGARIGASGEEDLFSFTADQPGRYVIETGGETDVVMKLFGPNSRTNLIAEDDDGGEGVNARIDQNLLDGEYLLQIRHYNRQGGTGDYTISVRR